MLISNHTRLDINIEFLKGEIIMWLNGSKLNNNQKNIVFKKFRFRNTHESIYDNSLRGVGSSYPIIISDVEWLESHNFQFINDGSRLCNYENVIESI